MEKYIQKLLKALRIEVVAVWVITVLAVCLGELNVIPNGWVEPHSQHEFVLNMAVVMLTMVEMQQQILVPAVAVLVVEDVFHHSQHVATVETVVLES